MYGTGTRSYNRSTEARQMKRELAEYAGRRERGELVIEPLKILFCYCLSFQFPHTPKDHDQLKGDWDWTPWQKRVQAWR